MVRGAHLTFVLWRACPLPAVAICLRCDREPYFKGLFVGRGVGEGVSKSNCLRKAPEVVFDTERAR